MVDPKYRKTNSTAGKKSTPETTGKKLNEESLITAAKKGDIDKVDSLLSQPTLDINFIDKNGYRAADHAWENKYYEVVLLLLMADSAFPKKFNLQELHGEGDLREFAEARDRLHDSAVHGNLDKVRETCYKTKSKYFLNKNESLLYTALRNKQYHIYSFLRSNGVDFLNEDEKSIIRRLSIEEKLSVAKSMMTEFLKTEPQHINYLTWKSKSEDTPENHVRRIRSFYQKLDRKPEISIILKVAQYSSAKIVFDFEGNEIGQSEEKTDGLVCIDANPQKHENEILWHLAQELTYIAMQIVFNNERNPYDGTDESSPKHMESIKEHILRHIRKINPKMNERSKHYYRQSEIVIDAIQNYDKKDHNSQLIARVPHILAKYENGREWLEEKVPDLLTFYREQVMAKCRDFINQRQKPENLIREINENRGELATLKINNVTFKTVDFIKGTLNVENRKNVFLLKSNDTLLATAKALQTIFGMHYTSFSDSYLALNSKALVDEKNKITDALNLEDCKFLIVRFRTERPKGEITDCMQTIQELVQDKPNLTVVYVTDYYTKEFVTKEVSNVIEIDDEEASLLDLTEIWKRKILSSEILFQGNKMKLFDLVGNDEILQGLIRGEVIEDILQGKRAHIENNVWEFTSSDEAYVGKEIEMDTLIHEIETSNDNFVISETEGKGKLTSYFKERLYREKVAGKINEENRVHLFGEGSMDYRGFKKFCQKNPKEKIHFIEVKDGHDKPMLMLQYVYNPIIYLKRNFSKNVVKQYQIPKMIQNCFSEYFIISNRHEAYYLDYLDMKDFHNVFVTDENLVPEYFNEFRNQKKPTHWFHVENDYLIWKKSDGSIENIRMYIDDRSEIKEDCLIKELKNKKVVIFSDKPGSGKTTAVNALLTSKSITEEHWIIKINLAYLKHIKGNYMNFPLKLLIEDLQNMKGELRKRLTANLLERALNREKKFPKRLLLVFDGFDEISQKDVRNKFCTFLKYLKHTTDCKIWVTTDPTHQHVLEEALSAFSVKLIPIEKPCMEQWIIKYLKNQSKLILNVKQKEEIFGMSLEKEPRIMPYVNHLLKTSQENIFQNNILGTPLLFKLILEIFIKEFLSWATGDSEINIDRLGRNIFEVYKNFTETKYEIYLEKFNICSKQEIKNCEEAFNQNLAISMTLNDDKPFKNQTEHSTKITLTRLENGNVIFPHSTIREYYFALFLISLLEGNFERNTVFDEKLSSTLLEILFEPEYNLIRYFVNLLLPRKNISMPIIDNCKIRAKILLTAFNEGNLNILYLILRSYPDDKVTYNIITSLGKFLTTKNQKGQILTQYLVTDGDQPVIILKFETPTPGSYIYVDRKNFENPYKIGERSLKLEKILEKFKKISFIILARHQITPPLPGFGKIKHWDNLLFLKNGTLRDVLPVSKNRNFRTGSEQVLCLKIVPRKKTEKEKRRTKNEDSNALAPEIFPPRQMSAIPIRNKGNSAYVYHTTGQTAQDFMNSVYTHCYVHN